MEGTWGLYTYIKVVLVAAKEIEEMASRKSILARRSTAINDLSKSSGVSGDLSYDSEKAETIIGRNNISSIGLGTESEVGLDAVRYPVRVILTNGTQDIKRAVVCVKGWAVKGADNNNIAFARDSGTDANVVHNLWTVLDQFEQIMRAELAKKGSIGTNAICHPLVETIYNLTSKRVMEAADIVELDSTVTRLRELCSEHKCRFYLKVGENQYMYAQRAGISVNDTSGVTGDMKVRIEFALTCMMNERLLADRYKDVSPGLAYFCGHAIAWYFRQGFYECHESAEFHTAVVEQVAGVAKTFRVVSCDAPEGTATAVLLKAGTNLSLATFKLSQSMIQVGAAGVYCAGLNHYTYNHTTVGTMAGGALLSVLKTNGLYDSSQGDVQEIEQTKMLYDALHPVNKRAIANTFFANSYVPSYGRPEGVSAGQIVELDSFLKIRSKPTPAGAHKAYIAGTVLQMVLRQNLGPFLEFASTINTAITDIAEVISCGARAHVGSSYYTGAPTQHQSSNMDIYLPDLAKFMQILAPRHSLCMSPHLSPEVAARSTSIFENVLKKVKGKELTAISDEKIEKFFNRAGQLAFTFDADDETTWDKAMSDNQKLADRIGSIMKI